MTKEKVLERVKQLETEREQLKANLIAYDGALQDCKFWLEKLETSQEEKKE